MRHTRPAPVCVPGGWISSGGTVGPVFATDRKARRLFEPFQRLGAARTGHNNGHGLGLSIAHAIASAHGAELTARPRQQGGLVVELSTRPSSAS